MLRKLILLAIVMATFGVSSAFAQTTVSAVVPSNVNVTLSKLTTDISQLPADGASLVVITATIVDSISTPLPNKDIVITSNRGDVDSIRCYDGVNLTDVNHTKTDAQGIARCVASSYAPGEATFAGAIAGTFTLDDHPTVTFTPLPTINNLNITVPLPGGKKLTILQPPKAGPPSPTPAPGVKSPPSGKKLVNTGIEIQIPFWVFLLFIFFIVSDPALLILVLRLSRKLRRGFEQDKKFVKTEEDLLSKIYFLEKSLAEHELKISKDSDLTEDLNQVRQTDQKNPPNAPQTPSTK